MVSAADGIGMTSWPVISMARGVWDCWGATGTAAMAVALGVPARERVAVRYPEGVSLITCTRMLALVVD